MRNSMSDGGTRRRRTMATRAGGWTLRRVADLEFWQRADLAYVTKDGSDRVEQTADLSGNGIPAIAAGAARPTWIASVAALNNMPVLRYNGSAMYMTANAIATGSLTGSDKPFTIFTVSTVASGGGNKTFWSIGNSSDNSPFQLAYSDDSNSHASFRNPTTGGGATFNLFGAHSPPNGTSIIVDRFTGTSFTAYLGSGGRQGTVAMDVNPLSVDQFTIGASKEIGPANYLNGDMAEVIVYSRPLTIAEIDLVANYLSVRYGLAWTDLE